MILPLLICRRQVCMLHQLKMTELKTRTSNVNELEIVLKEIFEKDIYVLQNSIPAVRTNVRRLILIYDYLKWGK